MNAIELIIVPGLALVGYFAAELFVIDDVVALPVIRGNGGARLDIVENEVFQGIPGTVQGDMNANATHSFLEVSALNGERHNGFAPGPTAALAGTLTTDKKFIDLDPAGQLFTIITDGAAPKLLKPGPGSAVTPKAQQFLQVHRIDTGFAGSEPPHGFEPVSDRLFGAVHDRAGCQRMLVFTLGADIQVP